MLGQAIKKAQLVKVCDEIVLAPELKPVTNADGTLTTYCNMGFLRVCDVVGVPIPSTGKEPPMADEIIAHLKASPDWSSCTALEAQKWAQMGNLAVAAMAEKVHGHIATVYPNGGMVYSGHFQQEVPTVANVGKTNGIMGANYAFPVLPDFFKWESDD